MKLARDEIFVLTHVNAQQVPGDSFGEGEYGLMIDGDLSDARDDVHVWIIRGANTALVYSGLLVLLSLTTSLHVDAGMKFSFLWDFLEASAMAFYKALLGNCALKAHLGGG